MSEKFVDAKRLLSGDASAAAAGLAIALSSLPAQILKETAPALLNNSNLKEFVQFRVYLHSETEFLCWVHYDQKLSMLSGGLVAEDEKNKYREGFEHLKASCKKGIVTLEDSDLCGPDVLAYIGPRDREYVDFGHMRQAAEFWLENYSLPLLLEENRQRVRMAIPTPPAIDLAAIINSLWVLECDETNKQGTAFSVNEVGLVTCAHSIGTASRAFRYNEPSKKFNVEVLRKNDTIDLAVCRIVAPVANTLSKSSSDELIYHDHILLAGHPNFRLGDKPVILPGLVVGFRTISSINRILTNAPIVCGMSGGPALSKSNTVVGVCVTGLDSMGDQNASEDTSIIPISALDLI